MIIENRRESKVTICATPYALQKKQNESQVLWINPMAFVCVLAINSRRTLAIHIEVKIILGVWLGIQTVHDMDSETPGKFQKSLRDGADVAPSYVTVGLE